jgi:hypothetical protein
MAGNFVSDNCRVVPTRLTTTALTTCLTATGYTQIVGVRLVNFHATSTPIVNFQYYSAEKAISYYYQANYTLPVAGALWFSFDAFAVNENDRIEVQSSIANTVDVFVLIAEVPGRSA